MRLGSIPLRMRPRREDRDAPVEPKSVGRVTALRLDRIGDLITTLPALRELKRRLPEARLELAVGRWNRAIAEGLDFVDSVRVIDMPWASWERRARYRDALAELRACRADMMIDFQGDVRVLAMMSMAQPRFRVGYADTGGGYLLTHRGRWDESISWYRQNMELVTRLFGGPTAPASVEPVNFLTEADREALRERLVAKGLGVSPRSKPLIGVHPSAGRGIKQWSVERFSELIRLAQHEADVVVTGAKADASLVEAITSRLKPDERPLTWIDEGSLRSFAALIENLDVFVTGDTGPMHIAQAVGCRSVALFGPSDPKRFGAEGGGRRLVVREPVFCSPCNMIRRPPTECASAAMPECMAGIRVEAVMDAVRRQLEQRSRP